MARHSRSSSASSHRFSGSRDLSPAHSYSGGNIQQSLTSSPESVGQTDTTTIPPPEDQAPKARPTRAQAPEARAPVEIIGGQKKRKINIGSQASVNYGAKSATSLSHSTGYYESEIKFLRFKVQILEEGLKEQIEMIPKLVQKAMEPALKVVQDFLQSLGNEELARKVHQDMLKSMGYKLPQVAAPAPVLPPPPQGSGDDGRDGQ